MVARRYSRQRERIYQAVAAKRNHPTAEEVYATLKPTEPRLSLGTVYRNLNQLSEEGRLLRLGGAPERYDAVLRVHGHFACSSCGRVWDKEMDWLSDVARTGVPGPAFTVQTIVLTGLCADCNQRNHDQEEQEQLKGEQKHGI